MLASLASFESGSHSPRIQFEMSRHLSAVDVVVPVEVARFVMVELLRSSFWPLLGPTGVVRC